jgi:hypothetical protein
MAEIFDVQILSYARTFSVTLKIICQMVYMILISYLNRGWWWGDGMRGVQLANRVLK